MVRSSHHPPNEPLMPRPRPTPYVWVTWLSSLLSGEASCEWAVWFKAHHFYNKRPSDFDFVAWQIEHTSLLSKVRDKYRADGYTVFVESQNEFKLTGAAGTLAGKPDLIALRGRSAVVIDVKAAKPKMAHTVQVMLYMWAVALADPRYKGITFDGRVIYAHNDALILAQDIDPPFVKRVGHLMRLICGAEPPPSAPSVGECRYCDIPGDVCPDRMDEGTVAEGTTDAF